MYFEFISVVVIALKDDLHDRSLDLLLRKKALPLTSLFPNSFLTNCLSVQIDWRGRKPLAQVQPAAFACFCALRSSVPDMLVFPLPVNGFSFTFFPGCFKSCCVARKGGR